MGTTPAELTPTPASEWIGKIEVEGTDLQLPSGNVARVKQMDPTVFLSGGVIPDPLMAIVNKAIQSKKGLPPSAQKEIMDDPKKLSEAMRMIDEVICQVVIVPAVIMPPKCDAVVKTGPNPADLGPCDEYANTDRHRDETHEQYHPYQEGERERGALYIDQVQMNDKMFIFQWCLGGTRDLEKFRDELSTTVGPLSDGQDVVRTPKRPARRK